MPVTHSPTKCRIISLMENRTMCYTIQFLSYEVGWNAFRSIRCNQFIVSKDNINGAHCFKNKKSMRL